MKTLQVKHQGVDRELLARVEALGATLRPTLPTVTPPGCQDAGARPVALADVQRRQIIVTRADENIHPSLSELTSRLDARPVIARERNRETCRCHSVDDTHPFRVAIRHEYPDCEGVLDHVPAGVGFKLSHHSASCTVHSLL